MTLNEVLLLYNGISFDMDGVICEDPAPDKDFGTPGYKDHLKNAKPKYIPNFTIEQIVTGRRDNYYLETEEWLKKHNVKYKELILKEKHRTVKETPRFKADIYKNADTELFIESSQMQAEEIFKLSGKSVYCMENKILYKL